MFKPYRFSIFIWVLTSCVFFYPLFFPRISSYYTTDIGTTDMWQLNLPLKHLLSQNLRSGQLPYWSNALGTGVPILAENQIGAFYLPNLVLYTLLSLPIAWNLSFITAIAISYWGTFVFLRAYKLSHHAATFGAVVFSYSSALVLRFLHLNLLQSLSLMPWVFFLFQKLHQRPSLGIVLGLGCVISQQICAGYPKLTIISVIGAFIYFTFLSLFSKAKLTKSHLLALGSAGGLSIVLALPQLIPTWQLYQISNYAYSQADLSLYPLQFKQLLTYLRPTIFGSAADGSYPLDTHTWGFFWENTFYIGLLPLILIGWFFVTKKRLNAVTKAALATFIVMIALALGNNSPLGVVYKLPVLNTLKVSARFMLVASFLLTLISARAYDQLIKQKGLNGKSLLAFFLIIFSFADLYLFGGRINPILDIDQMYVQPEITRLIEPGSRVYTHPSVQTAWVELYEKRGWSGAEDFIYFHNAVLPNQNLLWQINQVSYYLAIRPQRLDYYYVYMSPSLLNAMATDYIISAMPLNQPDSCTLVDSIKPPKTYLPEFYVYKNLGKLPRFKFVAEYQVISDITQIETMLATEKIDHMTTAILETDPRIELKPLLNAEIKVITETDMELVLATSTDQPALLVIADSFYPAWQATINDQPTQIYPANLNQRALVVPTGNNEIRFKYQ